jgi:hypothetical protein
MAGKREKPEDIVLKLRQVEVLQGQGRSFPDAVLQIGVIVQTYCRWRKDYGGMNRDLLKRLKELETENARLKHVVADLSLDKLILSERWRRHYNTVRPHSALGSRPPAPESMMPMEQRPTMH